MNRDVAWVLLLLAWVAICLLIRSNISVTGETTIPEPSESSEEKRNE